MSTLFDAIDRNPLADALAAKARGQRVIGIIGAGVPIDLVRSTGALPVRIVAEAIETPLADDLVSGEPEEIRAFLERGLDGSYAFLDLLIVTRQHEWLYYFLKEAVRIGAADLPPIHLHDVVFSIEPMMRAHNIDQIERLVAALARITGVDPLGATLAHAVELGNLGRAALRKIEQARLSNRLTGVDATAAIAASLRDPPEIFAAALSQWIDARPAPSPGPRLLLLGGQPWHAAIEAAGATVVAEDGELGSRSAQPDIAIGGNAVSALLDATLAAAVGQDVHPREARTAWAEAAIMRDDIQGVVFGISPADRKFGWDYPALRDHAAAVGKPALLLRDPIAEAPAIAAFVGQFASREQAA